MPLELSVDVCSGLLLHCQNNPTGDHNGPGNYNPRSAVDQEALARSSSSFVSNSRRIGRSWSPQCAVWPSYMGPDADKKARSCQKAPPLIVVRHACAWLKYPRACRVHCRNGCPKPPSLHPRRDQRAAPCSQRKTLSVRNQDTARRSRPVSGWNNSVRLS